MKTKKINSISEFFEMFPNEQYCIDYLEKIKWNGNVTSPFSKDSTVYKCKNNRYKCRDSGKYFNVKTGTIFESSNILLLKWFAALFVIKFYKKKISSYKLAQDIGITQKSAWFMLHRLKSAFKLI